MSRLNWTSCVSCPRSPNKVREHTFQKHPVDYDPVVPRTRCYAPRPVLEGRLTSPTHRVANSGVDRQKSSIGSPRRMREASSGSRLLSSFAERIRAGTKTRSYFHSQWRMVPPERLESPCPLGQRILSLVRWRRFGPGLRGGGALNER